MIRRRRYVFCPPPRLPRCLPPLVLLYMFVRILAPNIGPELPRRHHHRHRSLIAMVDPESSWVGKWQRIGERDLAGLGEEQCSGIAGAGGRRRLPQTTAFSSDES